MTARFHWISGVVSMCLVHFNGEFVCIKRSKVRTMSLVHLAFKIIKAPLPCFRTEQFLLNLRVN